VEAGGRRGEVQDAVGVDVVYSEGVTENCLRIGGGAKWIAYWWHGTGGRSLLNSIAIGAVVVLLFSTESAIKVFVFVPFVQCSGKRRYLAQGSSCGHDHVTRLTSNEASERVFSCMDASRPPVGCSSHPNAQGKLHSPSPPPPDSNNNNASLFSSTDSNRQSRPSVNKEAG
jgi:hypothetical protein